VSVSQRLKDSLSIRDRPQGAKKRVFLRRSGAVRSREKIYEQTLKNRW
jgi:hypothetical protein